jgi:acyl-CoA reductase-like NAD-dependent aldehyde dehydrogenase
MGDRPGRATIRPSSPPEVSATVDTASSPTPFEVAPGPYAYVPRLPVPDATPIAALDAAVAEVRAGAKAWTRASADARVRLLDEVLAAGLAVADRWTELAVRHEGLDPAAPESAEEAIVGPYIFLRGVRLHRDAMRDIARHGRPRIPGGARTLADGRVVARVMPTDAVDRLTYLGTSADVWMDRGLELEDLPGTMAVAHRTPPPGRVCLVLGAGNASSIGPLDAIHKVFVELQVVVLKTHPVMAHLSEVHEAALAPLVRAGLVRIVHGDAAEGAYLAGHPGVDTLHVTGSDRTYEAIVFGTGPDGEDRKRRDDPILHKPFSAELGNLTPIIVVPGRWSEGGLDYHATNIATMLVNNAGFNCTTSRVIVTARDWPQRAALLDRIRRRLAGHPPRLAFYPGSHERYAAFRAHYPAAETFGTPGDGELPWMLIPGLSPDAAGDPAYRFEAFCPVTAETVIDAPDAATFLAKATAFANERLWGTLNATVIVDPRSARDRGTRLALDRALDELRYGTVSLNHWSAIGYGLGITPWGAHPGQLRTDIGSGTGFVHNPLMFGRVEKTVVRSPFRAFPKPIWFIDHRTADRIVRELVRFEVDRSPARLLPIGALALRG